MYLVYQLQQPGVCPTFFGHTGSLVSQDNDLTGHLPCPLKSVPSASPLLVYSSHLPSTPPTTTLTAMALTIILLIGSIQIAMPTVLSVTLTVGVQNSGDPSEAHAGIKIVDFIPFNSIDKCTECTNCEEFTSKLKCVAKGVSGIILLLQQDRRNRGQARG